MIGTSPSQASRASIGLRFTATECQDGETNLFIKSTGLLEGEVMAMAIVTVGIDLAKNVFAVHGVDETGKASAGASGGQVRRSSRIDCQAPALLHWHGFVDLSKRLIECSCCKTAFRGRSRQAVANVCFAAIGSTDCMSAMSSKADLGQKPSFANDR